MDHRLVILLLLGCMTSVGISSQNLNSISNTEEEKALHDVIDSYSNVFRNQDMGCYCKQSFCECCENKIGNVCIFIGYYEVFDMPAAFGINITNDGKPFVSLTINVTHLPCIHLPYTKDSFEVCLQLHGFNKTDEYIRVLFDLKTKLMFTSFNVRLGCLLIPRLHPHSDSSKSIQYRDLLKQMDVKKGPTDLTGVAFCSDSPNSASEFSSKTIYIALLLSLLLIISKY